MDHQTGSQNDEETVPLQPRNDDEAPRQEVLSGPQGDENTHLLPHNEKAEVVTEKTSSNKCNDNESTESEPIINIIEKVDKRPRVIQFLQQKNSQLFLCSMVEFLFVFSYFSLIQILPDETVNYGITDWMIGLIQGSVGAVAIISSFFYMPLSKIWEQRTFMQVSLVLTALCDICIAYYEVLGIRSYALFSYFQAIHIVMGFVRFASFSAGGTIMTTLFMGDPDFRRKFGIYKSTTHISALLGIATVSYYGIIGFRATMMIPAVICLLVFIINHFALPADSELGDSLETLRAATQNNKKYPIANKPRAFSLLAVLLWCHTLLRYGIAGSSSYYSDYFNITDWKFALVMICSCLPSLVSSMYLNKLKGDPRMNVYVFSVLIPGAGCFFLKPLWFDINFICSFIFLMCMWEAITFVNVLVQDNLLIYLSQLYPNMKKFDMSKLASNTSVTVIFASLLIGPYLYAFAVYFMTFESFLWYFGISFFLIGAFYLLTCDYFFQLTANKNLSGERMKV